MLGFTQKEKEEWAKALRAPSTLPFSMPEGYMDVLEQVQCSERMIPGRDGHEIRVWVTKTEKTPPKSMLYINIHGGGFVQEHAIYDHALCAIMAKELNCTVLDIDYRLAPEFPYPAGLNDCFDVTCWVYDHADELGIDSDQIMIGGNSAGGTFCAGVCMKLAEEKKKQPKLAVMLYPAANMEKAEGVDLSNLDLSDLKNRGLIYDNLYLESDEQYEDPYVNLSRAELEMLEQFPDAVIVTAGLDPLGPGGEEFAKRLAVSGSRIVLQRFRNSKHGFYLRCMGDEWQAARKLVFEEIKRKMK